MEDKFNLKIYKEVYKLNVSPKPKSIIEVSLQLNSSFSQNLTSLYRRWSGSPNWQSTFIKTL